MVGINCRRLTSLILTCLLVVVISIGLVGCGRKSVAALNDNVQSASTSSRSIATTEVSEVSPPEVIQELRVALESFQPQVKIISPQANEVLQDNTVIAKLQVEELPLFKDAQLEMGPHLHVILDNQPYQAIYVLSQPLTFQDLEPGTHTLRVFASRPWHESFKNEGAYAETTFHVFTKTRDNNLNPALPLLTYSRPQGSYGAEPIMVDFYLTNAPLHLVAQERSDDQVLDWQIRCTLNGVSFQLDRWQPIYLKGFRPGKNWVQLELLDEQGNLVQNAFNSTVRLITYKPGGQDTLSKLVRGELKAADAHGIVDPHDTASETPTLAPLPAVTSLMPSTPPQVLKTPAPETTASDRNQA